MTDKWSLHLIFIPILGSHLVKWEKLSTFDIRKPDNN